VTSAERLRVLVFVEDWQIECCGVPPAVGDEVEWGLILDGRPPGVAADPEAEIVLDGVASPHPLGGARFDAGGLHAWWRNPDGSGPVSATGELTEDHHGALPEDVPRTVGRITRVRIVTRHWVPVPGEQRSWQRGPGMSRYRDVGRSPKRFASADAGGTERWADDGVLVDLVVREPADTPS
jgi:Family of unknown function (DUF6578)